MPRRLRFMDFPVYKEAKSFYKTVAKNTQSFPRQYWDLGEQMRRSSLSVILNLAEGSAKKSDKDFNRYLKNSLGSVNECAAALDVAHDAGLIPDERFRDLLLRAESIGRQLGGFSKKLKSTP